LVTYIGPDSYELSRLLAAIREIPRPADPAPWLRLPGRCKVACIPWCSCGLIRPADCDRLLRTAAW